MAPALLVLAAGLGSRYGGLKQIEPVGPSGETLLDYAVFDALRAGFGRVVFVIRRDFEDVFRAKVGGRYAGRAEVGYAFQELDALPASFAPPAGREKPWGTGHALWCARNALDGTFAAINADDFYGADAFARLAAFLQASGGPAPGVQRTALAGFRLADTLSEHGPVSRGVCRIEGGRLLSIEERTAITPADVGYGRAYSGDEIVSMNCWGFGPGIFPLIEAQLAQFLEIHAAELRAEFYLPEALSRLVARGEAEVEVLPARGPWFGVTHREDRPRVAAAIAALVRGGAYPAALF
jgi:NDP-sugar pyrophosphorylase family protein